MSVVSDFDDSCSRGRVSAELWISLRSFKSALNSSQVEAVVEKVHEFAVVLVHVDVIVPRSPAGLSAEQTSETATQRSSRKR